MSTRMRMSLRATGVLIAALLATDAAHAFRCKNKIVRDGLHELQVIAICGEPTSRRHLGYAIRSIDYGWPGISGGGIRQRRFPGVGYLSEEVAVTEFVYNFGPRKLMRQLIFEGGILVRIETLGYGY